jgi:hypothetical protein
MTASWGVPNRSQGLSSFTRSRAFSMQRSSPCSRARRSAAIWVRSSSMSKLLSPVTHTAMEAVPSNGREVGIVLYFIIMGLSRLYVLMKLLYMKDLYDHMPKGECDLGFARRPVRLSVRFMQIPRSNKGFHSASRRIPFSCSRSINNEYGFMQRCQLINAAQRRCLTALNYL